MTVPALPPVQALFVGREHELTTLTRALAAARSGQGGVALLAGEAGIGKTRLAEELAATARTQGVRVVWGRCYEGEGAPAFWPWVQVLRTLLTPTGDQLSADLLGAEAAEVSRLLPELAGPEPAGQGATTTGEAAEQRRFHLFDSIARVLARCAAAAPLLLLLDDLHWADVPSLLLLEFVSQALAEHPVLLLGGYRDETAVRGHPLARTLGALTRGPRSVRLTLSGLDSRAAAAIIEATTGAPPSSAIVSQMMSRSEGNPLFVTELARLLRGQVAGSDPATPAVVREVIGRRLDRLSADCDTMLITAAVVGREFEGAVLEQIGMPAGAVLWDALEEAEAARVIEGMPGRPGRYRFTHALIRETLYDELPAVRRARLHGRVGAALETVYVGNLDPHLAELAWHFAEAAAAGGAPEALAYTERAAARAAEMFAYEEAVRLYKLAAGLAADAGRHCELLILAGEAQRDAGDIGGTETTILEAVAAARRLLAEGGHPRAAALLARAAFGLNVLNAAAVHEYPIQIMEEALAALGEDVSPERVRLLHRLAAALQFTGPMDRRDALIAEAVATARRLGDDEALCEALGTFSFMLWRPEQLHGRLAFATEFQAISERGGLERHRMHANRLLFIACLDMGDRAGAVAAHEAHTRQAQARRLTLDTVWSGLWRVMWALLEGRAEEAGHRLVGAQNLAEQVDHPDKPLWFLAQSYVLKALEGRLSELEPMLRGFADQLPGLALLHASLAELYAEDGRLEAARATLLRLVAPIPPGSPAPASQFAHLLPMQEGLPAATHAADVCATLGERGWAADLYDLLLPYAGLSVLVGPVIVWYGAVSHRLGRLAALLDRPDQAERHFEEALALYERLGARPWLARACCDLAVVLSKQAEPPAAARAHLLVERAAALAQELGLAWLSARVEQTAAVLREVGVGVAAVAQPPAGALETLPTVDTTVDAAAGAAPTGLDGAPTTTGISQALPDGLTPREAEVLHLLATGLSTAEVAERLVLAEPTVRRHITNLYTKIGARNRAEATAYAIRHHLN